MFTLDQSTKILIISRTVSRANGAHANGRGRGNVPINDSEWSALCVEIPQQECKNAHHYSRDGRTGKPVARPPIPEVKASLLPRPLDFQPSDFLTQPLIIKEHDLGSPGGVMVGKSRALSSTRLLHQLPQSGLQ